MEMLIIIIIQKRQGNFQRNIANTVKQKQQETYFCISIIERNLLPDGAT